MGAGGPGGVGSRTDIDVRKPRTGPLARINLFRLVITLAIVVTAVLAFTLQGGVFRFAFRAALVVGVVLLVGSYLLEVLRRRRRE